MIVSRSIKLLLFFFIIQTGKFFNTVMSKAGFPLGEFVRANQAKSECDLAGDVVSVCHQPIKLLLSLFARTKSPSGKPA